MNMSISPSKQVLLGGVLCLDFVNTRAWKPDQPAHDFFLSYLALLEWGLHLELLSQAQAENMLAVAERDEKGAQVVLKQAVLLRSAIYAIFSTAAQGQAVSTADLKTLNEALSKTLPHLQVLPAQDGFAWRWTEDASALDRVLWPVLHSAAELLISDKLERVKRCDGCGWLFLDATKAGNRRWCDMRFCGNRAKVRRHYAREKQARQG
jgi:predicted RNA-binding Zn ribbon-like protein